MSFSELYKSAVAKDMMTAERQELYDCQPYHTAARLVRFFSKEFSTLMQEVGHNLVSTQYDKGDKSNYLAYPYVTDKKEVKVRVFTNVLVKYDESSSYIYSADYHQCDVVWWGQTDVLKKFYTSLKADMESGKDKRWVPTSRGIKRVKSYTDYTVARYLTKFFYSSNSRTDAQIRDIANNISEAFLPLKIHECMTPEDWIKTFENGVQSCMNVRSEYASEWAGYVEETKALEDEEKRFHPGVWYYWHPQIAGVYIKRGPNVTARTLVFTDVDGAKSYSRIMSTDNNEKNKLRRHLDNLGYKYYVQGDHITLKEDFEIPAYKVRDQRGKGAINIVPIPYADRIYNSYKITYDTNRDMFVFTYSKNSANIDLRRNRGHLISHECDTRQCEYCDEVIYPGYESEITQDGKIFCSPNHAQERGYVSAVNDGDTAVWIQRADAFVDAIEDGMYYTNHEAALRVGAMPVLSVIDGIPENGSQEVSKYGQRVFYNDVEYRTSYRDYDYLESGGYLLRENRKKGGKVIIDKFPLDIAPTKIMVNVHVGEMIINR
ncbi:MAG TPA: hypothetical protein DHN29_24560 [Cytophagales bacterium]|nr:hypothetical protein [Cytophagales bacterium]